MNTETLTDFVSYHTKTPSLDQVEQLQRAYDHFNATLFSSSLPPCLIVTHRHKGAHGYFCAEAFTTKGDATSAMDELALNPESFYRSDMEILGTLAHEMCHVYQQHHGKPSRSGYHNKEFARIMADIGLICSTTGEPGGKQTGQNMTHYIQDGGRFERAAQHVIDEGFTVRWQARPKGSTGSSNSARSKVAYTCTSCSATAWGKPDLRLVCGACMLPMVNEQDDEAEED